MLGFWVFKGMVGHLDTSPRIFAMMLILSLCPLPKGFIRWAIPIIMHIAQSDSRPLSQKMDGRRTSNSEFPPPSTSPPVVEGEDPPLEPKDNIAIGPFSSLCPSTSPPVVDGEDLFSQPKDNIAATPSLEPKAGESPPSLAFNSEDPLLDGWSMKGNVDAPPPPPTNPALL